MLFKFRAKTKWSLAGSNKAVPNRVVVAKGVYSKNPHIRTQWFKNLQAEIWPLNTQKSGKEK